jgi:hypothetical protein
MIAHVSSSEELTSFLGEQFAGIRLIPAAYHGAPFLRFSFGGDLYDDRTQRVEVATERASAVFAHVFDPSDEGFVRYVSWRTEDDQALDRLLPPEARADLERIEGTNYYDDPDRNLTPYAAFTARVRPCSIDYVPLFRGVANVDNGFKPIVGGRVFLINRSRPAIFHMYDDRGGVLIGPSAEALTEAASQFSEWVIEDPNGRRKP